jgi:SAM-dependent methyltransferase
MFTKLDQRVIDLLCCPLCKSRVIRGEKYFICASCATQYPQKPVNVGEHVEQVYDFRIQRPSYCVPEASVLWAEGQNAYESLHESQSSQDELGTYLDEIDSVTEIYTQEFKIQGSVLDVGGHQGRVRHFLSDREMPIYVSIDPFLDVFENIQSQPNLLKAYPCLSQPCDFVAARAEELPFIENSFDWVHMRSVIDHFEDPFFAFKEAYRVLKPNGRLMIGLAIMEKLSHARMPLLTRVKLKLERDGITGMMNAIKIRARRFVGSKGMDREEDHHIFHFRQEELKDLLSVTGFKVNKEHWQKPPFSFCIYLSASANKTSQL